MLTWIPRAKSWLAVVLAILSVIGLVTFSQFILEEAFQTVMFSTWAAQDAQRYDVVLKGADIMRSINRKLKIITYSLGWIQPLALMAYFAYIDAAEIYIEALEAKILAKAPELMVGRTVSLRFKPQKVESTASGWLLVNGRVAVWARENPGLDVFQATGKVTIAGNRVVVMPQ